MPLIRSGPVGSTLFPGAYPCRTDFAPRLPVERQPCCCRSAVAPLRRHRPLTLSVSLEWASFGGGGPARLDRRPLLGEPAEARVQKGSDNGANDRGRQVQPGIVE